MEKRFREENPVNGIYEYILPGGVSWQELMEALTALVNSGLLYLGTRPDGSHRVMETRE